MTRVRTALVLLGFAVVASTARAEVYIELTALTPENASGGYLSGTTVEFQVAVSADNAHVEQVRGVTLDFTESSPELDFIDPFHWDFSTLTTDALYAEFLDYPLSNITYQAADPYDGFVLEIPMGAPLVLGTGFVLLPADPGVYWVDAVGHPDREGNGARIDLFSDPPCDFPPCVRPIVNDPLALTVVPEPGSLVLLGLGAVAMLRRRVRARA